MFLLWAVFSSVVYPDLVGFGGSESTSTECDVDPYYFPENFSILSKIFKIITPMTPVS
jgi:hypothetical protein